MLLSAQGWFLIVIFVTFIKSSQQSTGDNSYYYQNCLERCTISNCTDSGIDFNNGHRQPFHLQITKWSCFDECCYECMWKTVAAFQKRNWTTYQFYGKWPFIRLFGLQEPASVLFSLLNLYVHVYMLKKFRKFVHPDTRYYFLWHFYSGVSINAWVWSAIFHARDTPLTEYMDYVSAFAILMVSLYCMTIRILSEFVSKSVLIIVTTLYGAIFLNHAIYLSYQRVDYNYNMQLNLLIGILTATGWYSWCMLRKQKQTYTWKCAVYVTLTGMATLLEITDRPPIFFLVDFHALWHLATAPIQTFFYNFIIDDSRYLMQQKPKKTL